MNWTCHIATNTWIIVVLVKDIMGRKVGSCRSCHIGVLMEEEKMFSVHALYHTCT